MDFLKMNLRNNDTEFDKLKTMAERKREQELVYDIQ